MLSHLDSRQGGHDGGGAEAVGDEREVSEMSLYTGVQQRLGPGVAQGGPVLVQQVHQLLRYGSAKIRNEPGENPSRCVSSYFVASTRSFLLYCSAGSWLSLTM